MNNYDSMTVDEPLPLYNWNIINATLGKITEDAAGRKGFELFTAIKKARIEEASVGTCEWKENEDGMWNTSCENTFVFDEGGPEENEQKFCCYCGKPLKAVPFVYPTEEAAP